jgi:hypothetical protein
MKDKMVSLTLLAGNKRCLSPFLCVRWRKCGKMYFYKMSSKEPFLQFWKCFWRCSAMKMVAKYSPKTLVSIYQTTLCYNLGDFTWACKCIPGLAPLLTYGVMECTFLLSVYGLKYNKQSRIPIHPLYMIRQLFMCLRNENN